MASIGNPLSDDQIVAVVPPARVDAALEAVRPLGDDVEVLCGAADAERIDVDGDDSGWATSVARFFQQGEEQDTLAEFRRRVIDGDSLVIVEGVGDRHQEAADVLVDHGADLVWHYGEFTYQVVHREAD